METLRLTAAMRKETAALKSARNRRAARLFTIEGTRGVLEALAIVRCLRLIATAAWLDEHGRDLDSRAPAGRIFTAKADEIERMATSATPQGVIGVFEMPEPAADTLVARPGELILALDHIQDPGNIGTIIRLADWFGITKIWASTDTADIYSPKVIQSTMGAIARVSVAYTDLATAIARAADSGVPVYGTFLDGTDLYSAPLTPGGIIVMGNEGNGISPAIAVLCNRRLLIPPYPADAPTVESLNVGVATAITVAEFRRRLTAPQTSL